jgi:hypothetical protein
MIFAFVSGGEPPGTKRARTEIHPTTILHGSDFPDRPEVRDGNREIELR